MIIPFVPATKLPYPITLHFLPRAVWQDIFQTEGVIYSATSCSFSRPRTAVNQSPRVCGRAKLEEKHHRTDICYHKPDTRIPLCPPPLPPDSPMDSGKTWKKYGGAEPSRLTDGLRMRLPAASPHRFGHGVVSIHTRIDFQIGHLPGVHYKLHHHCGNSLFFLSMLLLSQSVGYPDTTSLRHGDTTNLKTYTHAHIQQKQMQHVLDS